ncbi:uncharacterized protein LOC131652662 [Vicia villosa]|uniref:uncharacterized protein LOC131652662 n=1 Tax=Vicia villosa TaxID=3911 RepID=UPI00273B48F9|nr:uncharacterized protein LOC131652662 [Vicia villosa]
MNLNGVDIDALRNGTQINMEQRKNLIKPVIETKIEKALKGIGDSKAPGRGYGSIFFRATWNIIKSDLITAIQEFFEKGKLNKAINESLIIAKIMAEKLGEVLPVPDIIRKNQATFVPSQKIQDHILLAYELIKRYCRKGGTPRCMPQMDI